MGTGPFPGAKCGRGVLLTTHPLLVPRHGRVELYLYPPSGPRRTCNGITLPLYPLIHHRRDKNCSMKYYNLIKEKDLKNCKLSENPKEILKEMNH